MPVLSPASAAGHRAVAKGHFGAAYVHTVVAGAGLGVQIAGSALDAAGVDLTVVARQPGTRRRAHELHLQVKCTDHGLEDEAVVVDLDRKNYDELRDDSAQVPLVLVVVVVPEDPVAWVEQTDEALIARRCAWWMSLMGQPERDNTSQVRVRIPRSQVFSRVALEAMMTRIANGESP